MPSNSNKNPYLIYPILKLFYAGFSFAKKAGRQKMAIHNLFNTPAHFNQTKTQETNQKERKTFKNLRQQFLHKFRERNACKRPFQLFFFALLAQLTLIFSLRLTVFDKQLTIGGQFSPETDSLS
jgi:hypothetical protein